MLVEAARFSALQRAENSSITDPRRAVRASPRFSALQRAENSSIRQCGGLAARRTLFQCSSASRKFLNGTRCDLRIAKIAVSVLFSEPKIPQYRRRRRRGTRCRRVSVLFSEPKIPQLISLDSAKCRNALVSVLFSEPKIPQ